MWKQYISVLCSSIALYFTAIYVVVTDTRTCLGDAYNVILNFPGICAVIDNRRLLCRVRIRIQQPDTLLKLVCTCRVQNTLLVKKIS